MNHVTHTLLCRYSLAYVYAQLLHQDLVEFVEIWNNHRLRKNRLANCPLGIPNDIHRLPHKYGMSHLGLLEILPVYYIFVTLHCTGTTNYLRTPVDVDVFHEAVHQFCAAKPQFYPVEFSLLADAVLAQEMNMVHSDITHANCDAVFRTLTEFINTL